MGMREEIEGLHIALITYRGVWADNVIYEKYPEVVSSVPVEDYRRYFMGHKEIVEGLRDTLMAANEGWSEGAVSDGVYGSYLESITRGLHSELMLIEKELQEETLQFVAVIKEDINEDLKFR